MKTWMGAALLPLLFLSACSSPAVKPDVDAYPERRLPITVNGTTGKGTIVVPRAAQYLIEIEASSDIDYLQMDSCHRRQAFEKADKKFKYLYVPNAGENSGYCPVDIAGYNKDKYRVFGAWFEYKDPRYQLKACLDCNGARFCEVGSAVCQAPDGKIQWISFENEVVLSSKQDTCNTFTTKDSKLWDYRVRSKECTVTFMEKEGEHKMHRLQILGFDAINPEKK